MKLIAFLIVFLFVLPSLASAMTFNITIESTRKNSVGTIISKPNGNILVYGQALYADSTPFASKPLSFNYSGIVLGTNNTAADGRYNFTFSLPYSGNYTLTVGGNDTGTGTGINSSVLLVSYAPSNVKYRLSYHIGTLVSDDIERIGNVVNLPVDSRSGFDLFYSSNSSLVHAFACTYNASNPPQLLSLIHSYQRNNLNYINFTAKGASADYYLELSQKISGSSLLVAYTQGTCDVINNNAYLVEKNQYPSRSFASFSFAAQNEIHFIIRAQYDRIKLNGTEVFGSGANIICVSKDAITANNYPFVTVKRC
jgi:hypothetical protein